MRLINTHTFEQKDRFQDNRTPPYAILSHRWGEHEISYQDFLNTPKTSFDSSSAHLSTDQNSGASKIAHACAQAKGAGLEWIWIDTCCIDKTSSAELGKSINSMFRWYQDAQVCFAHLADVNRQGQPKKRAEIENEVLDSKWFTRGWTLQEMLAPREMQFFDASWGPIGSRSQLTSIISKAAKISPEHLKDFRGASTAQKMSWMADRVTSEEEDTAYCMLGIFDLNMDLRYGEGKRAFGRLQEMIIASSTDESIFAWRGDQFESSGLLAPWPDCFRHSGDIILRPDKISHPRPSYQMTSQGLKFPAPILLVKNIEYKGPEYLLSGKAKDVDLSIQCWVMEKGEPRAVVLFLSKSGGYWKRVRCGEWGTAKTVKMKSWVQIGAPALTLDIYIPQREVVRGR